MTLANIRIYAPFMAILLLFYIFAGQPAIANPNALPESVAELLSGKTTDFSSVVSQLPDQQLLSALSAGEMLKFKAAHGEISLDVSGASAFINLINKRLEQSQIVSFVQNDTCCKPVEQREIVYEGQRLIIPAHFTAELDLAIISCAPAGEAGSICPDFCVNVFSQSPLTDKILKIDGEAVAPEKVSIIQSAGKQQVLYRPDLDIACLLSIGTHTAEIIISNKAEEKVRKNWQFTVGVYDIPTNPMPADLLLLKEVGLPLDKFLPGGKAFGELTALIYQNAKGERFIEYRLKAEAGQIFTSQNLAFIARKAFKGRNTDNELQLFPKTHFAFAGNSLKFSYAYSGPGQVINEKWEIPSAGHSSADPVIIMTDNDVYARCVITVEEQFTNNNGEIETYTYQVTAEKRINSIGLKTSIQPYRSLIIADSASCSLSIGNITLCRLQTSGMVEGQQYNVTSDITGAPVTGVLKVNRLRWVKHASEGFSTVLDPVATTTTLLFEEPGYAELVLAVDLTWQEAGETYTSNYKPDVSGLYAFYPVTGKAKFTKYPIGQIRYTNRHLVIKSFEFTIKDQQITIDEPSDYQLTSPVHICSSAIWPASSPIIIDKAYPFLLENNSYWFHEDSDFTVTTPMVTNNDPKKEFKLKLGCEFYYTDDYHSNRQIISELPSIPIFSELDVLELNTIPDKQVTAYEGAEVKFSAEILPKSGFGSGKITAFNNTLDILNGYKVSVENLSWFDLYNENPDNENPETDPVKSALNSEFSHTLIAWDTGSRTVKCVLDARIKDSDTASDINVLTEKKVPVNILPGLNIYSPIEDLAYPLHGSVKVKTSFDSDKKLWNEIKWYLNGKLIEPGVKEPPFFIDLNRTGKWSLGASLKINNPGGDSPPPLAATVTFLVQPVDISLSPYRKILDLAEQKFQSLSLAVALNGKTAEKPGDLIPWQSDEVFAVVEPVQWKTAQVPDGFASEEFDEESFSGNLNFTSHGAATILATVTVRLTGAEKAFKRRHKKENDKFEIPIFEFPAVRADLWAVDKPVWANLTSNLPDEQFPGQAVTPAGRTFKIKNGIVSLDKDKYEWSSQTGFKTRISIPAAIPDSTTLPATCKTVNFEWSCEGNDSSHDIKFIPTFKKAGTAIVKLKSSLVFDDKYQIPFVEKNFSVSVQNIESLVQYYIDPKTFQMPMGGTKKFNFFLNPIESVPAIHSNGSEFYILNGIYKISLEEVDWQYEVASNSSSVFSSYDFILNPAKIGNYKISGKAKCWVIEFPFSPNAIKWPWSPESESFGSVAGLSVEIFGNNEPLESGEYYLGQEIELSYKVSNLPEDIVIEKQNWVISSPTPKSFSISDDLNSGYMIPAPEQDFKNKTIKFCLYDYFLPEEEAVSFGRKTGTLILTFGNKEYAYPFFLPYKKPYLKNVEILPPQQQVRVVKDSGDSKWKIGFPDKNVLGIHAHAEIFNPTGRPYLITSTSFVRLNNKRRFSPNPLSDCVQFKKTITSSASLNTSSEFWLDTYSPGTDYPDVISKILYPGSHEPRAILADDIPLFLLELDEPGIPKEFEANASFVVIFWVKPAPLDTSTWCPIRRMTWSWSGTTQFDQEKLEWIDNPNSYSVEGLSNTSIEFPKWFGWAHPKITYEDGTEIPEHPIWREQ